MQVTRFLFILAIGAIAASCSTIEAASPATIEEEVLALERSFRAAQLSKDPAALARLLPSDYVHIHAGDGKLSTRDEYIAHVTGPALTYTEVDARNPSFRHYGNVVVAISDVAVTGTSRGNPIRGADGGPFQFRSARTYVKRDGRWQPIFAQGTAL